MKMANKIYTAQEMRNFADAIAGDLNESGHTSVRYSYNDLIPVIESLRQAADTLEREKRYQYEVWYTANDGGARRSSGRACSLKGAKCILSMYKEFKNARIVRREVGEWEEIKETSDGE